MKEKVIRLTKALCFLTLAVLGLYVISSVLQKKWVEFETTSDTYIVSEFYELEDRNLDIAVIGSSQTVRDISCMRLLEDHHLSAYSLSGSNQPFIASYFYLREFLRYGRPKLVILDTSMLYERISSSLLHRVVDNAPLSINKIMLAYDYAKYVFHKKGLKKAGTEFWSFVFPVIQYHSRWNELTETDFDYKDKNRYIFRGNGLRSKKRKVKLKKILIDGDEPEPDLRMTDFQLLYFRKLIELCQKEDIQVLLIKTPKGSWSASRSAGVEELAQEYGLDYLDFNRSVLFNAVGLDAAMDFSEPEHLNMLGAFKLTDYLADYVLGKYDFRIAAPTEQDMERLPLYHEFVQYAEDRIYGRIQEEEPEKEDGSE